MKALAIANDFDVCTVCTKYLTYLNFMENVLHIVGQKLLVFASVVAFFAKESQN